VHLYNPLVSVVPFASLHGASAADLMGLGGITVLANNNFVVSSPGGANNVGTVQLIDGSIGTQIGPTLAGDNVGDPLARSGITVLGNGNYVVSSRTDNEGGVAGVGSVRLLSGVTGVQLVPALSGDTADDQLRTAVAAPSHGGFFVVGFSTWNNGSVDGGRVRLIAE
jgi:hypothetical protein